jgi:hypothetical protein
MEPELENVDVRAALTFVENLRRQQLDYLAVGGRQIMSALLAEIKCGTGLPNESLLWRTLQAVANEARRRGLLINPNPYSRETYSKAVGNTTRMLPSDTGWEQTKGILTRRIADLRNMLQRAAN